MIKGHSWAGIAASLAALAWLGLPTTALAQEESGTKTAFGEVPHSFSPRTMKNVFRHKD